jgi:hypothetical protein
MLQVKELDTVNAGQNAVGAFLNAEFTSRKYRVMFSSKQQAQAETFRDILCMAYPNVLEPTYRKTMITVKVNSRHVIDKKMAKIIMQICEERGYRVRPSSQGINFNIPKV